MGFCFIDDDEFLLNWKKSFLLCSWTFILVSFYLFMMQDYQRVHPEVTVIDPPDAIQRLRNRQSMLEVVVDLKLPDSYGNFLHHCTYSNESLLEILI